MTKIIYEYRCRNGHEFERVLPVADYKTPQRCHCGAEGRRILSLPRLIVKQDIRYDSPVTGAPITSERARREDLARHNCIEYDPEMRTDYQRRIADNEAKLDKAVEATVEAEISRMPARKREKLEAELKGGSDVTVERLTPFEGVSK